MARMSNADLERQLAALEAENAELRARLDAHSAAADPVVVANSAVTPRRRRGWGWTLLAVALILIGAILAPVAVVSSWAKAQLTDTDAFVATYAPLADDPDVQKYVTQQTVTLIEDKVDIPQLTSQVIDGITDLGTGPVATKALDALKGPLAQGVVSLIQDTVSRFVASDAFTQVWEQALRTSHTQLVATMQGDPKAAIAVGSDGSIGIQLAPIIDRVKQLLVDRGISFANQIPTIDKTITVAQNSTLPTIQLLYGIAVAAGAWLPWVAIGLLALGVIIARRRALALIGAASALALAMIVTVAGIGIGRAIFIASASPTLLPAGVARTVYATVTTAMQDTGIAVLVLAIVVALVAWFAGPFPLPRRLRGFFGSGVTWIRDSAESHGVSTGRSGEWLYRQRTLLRAIVAAIAAAIVLVCRPLTPALIIWTLVIAALVIAILELVQRPVVTVPEQPLEPPAADPEAAELIDAGRHS